MSIATHYGDLYKVFRKKDAEDSANLVVAVEEFFLFVFGMGHVESDHVLIGNEEFAINDVVRSSG